MLMRTLVAARDPLLKVIVQMSKQIRGLMKTFGLVVPKVLAVLLRAKFVNYSQTIPSLKGSSCRCSTLGGACACRPSSWRGNSVLPRVRINDPPTYV